MRIAYAVLAFASLICLPGMAWSADRITPANVAVNTDKDEDEPYSSVRGTAGQLFFTRDGELHTAQRRSGKWLSAKPFEELLQHRGDYNSVFVSYQKSSSPYPHYLIYATNHDVNKTDGRGNNFDIYLKLRDQPDGADINVAIPLHFSTADDEMHPWLAFNGTLYFSRKTKDGWRVCAATAAKEKMTFNKPQPLDLPAGFHHATLMPDGRTMYLQGPLENNRTGLFRSKLVSGKWSSPEELKELNDLNAKRGDRSPSLSRDGSTLYFASDRAGGKGGLDLWMVPTQRLKN